MAVKNSQRKRVLIPFEKTNERNEDKETFQDYKSVCINMTKLKTSSLIDLWSATFLQQVYPRENIKKLTFGFRRVEDVNEALTFLSNKILTFFLNLPDFHTLQNEVFPSEID